MFINDFFARRQYDRRAQIVSEEKAHQQALWVLAKAIERKTLINFVRALPTGVPLSPETKAEMLKSLG